MDASGAPMAASGTTIIPATCATPINGIATKFRPRPANVTRENTIAPTGNSTASAAADAANIATSGRSGRRHSRAKAMTAGTTTRIASVAPQVRANAGSATDSGSLATSSATTSASQVTGGLPG